MKNMRFTLLKRMALLIALTVGLAACKKDYQNTPEAKDYHQNAPTQYLAGADAKIAYRVLGEGEGTPLIMVSSLGSTMDDWDPAVTNGLAAKSKVIIFDLPGVGRSTGKTPNNIADMAKSTFSFIKALGLKKVNLLGFSMGSFITQQIVLTEPALVERFVLTGTGPKGSQGLSNLPNLLAATAGLTPEEVFLKFAFTSSPTSIAAGKRSWDRSQKRTTDRDLPLTQDASLAELTAVLGWAQPYPEAFNELSKVTQPVLIVQGENDLPVPVINAVNISKSIPNAKIIIYPDAGHASFAQNPEMFVASTNSFLGK